MSAVPTPSLAVKPSVTLKRRLNAPAEKVYAAWTDPEKLIHWFGPSDTREGSVDAQMDVRVGGRFKVSFNTLDGERHQVGGEYKEVVPNEKLVFSWAWHSTPERESLVTVTMKEDGDQTILAGPLDGAHAHLDHGRPPGHRDAAREPHAAHVQISISPA